METEKYKKLAEKIRQVLPEGVDCENIGLEHVMLAIHYAPSKTTGISVMPNGFFEDWVGVKNSDYFHNIPLGVEWEYFKTLSQQKDITKDLIYKVIFDEYETKTIEKV